MNARKPSLPVLIASQKGLASTFYRIGCALPSGQRMPPHPGGLSTTEPTVTEVSNVGGRHGGLGAELSARKATPERRNRAVGNTKTALIRETAKEGRICRRVKTDPSLSA